MARIRTVKPEFWSSPDTAACADPWARLLFIAMWNWADDTGRGTANPKELAGFAFPNDDDIDAASIRRMLDEVSRAFGVILYKVGGRTYYAIPSWDDHQKIDRKSQAKYPGPEDGDPWSPDPAPQPDQRRNGHSPPKPRVVTEDSTSMQRTLYEPSGTGTGEQGNRGSKETPIAAAPEKTDDEWFAEFWTAYPRKVDKQDGLRAFKALLKKRTVKPERLVQAALSYGQSNAGQETKYLKHAATWLNKGSYDNEPEQTHLSLVPSLAGGNATESLEHLRETANGRAAAELIGRPYLPKAQPPSDPTPVDEWDRREALRFLAEHEHEIREALAEREAG